MTTQAPDIVENPIVRVVTESGVSADLGKSLIDTFGRPFAEAAALIAESRNITVTDATQLTEMKAARAARIKLAGIRTAAERAKQEEDRRIREENARLQREKEAAEAAARAEREKAEAAERSAAQKAAAERAEIERQARAEQARIEAERQKEREAAEAKLAEERAARKAAAAPDAEKLRTLAKLIATVPMPPVTDVHAKSVLAEVQSALSEIAGRLNQFADVISSG